MKGAVTTTQVTMDDDIDTSPNILKRSDGSACAKRPTLNGDNGDTALTPTPGPTATIATLTRGDGTCAGAVAKPPFPHEASDEGLAVVNTGAAIVIIQPPTNTSAACIEGNNSNGNTGNAEDGPSSKTSSKRLYSSVVTAGKTDVAVGAKVDPSLHGLEDAKVVNTAGKEDPAFTTPATAAVDSKMTVEFKWGNNTLSNDPSPSPKNLYSIFSPKAPSKSLL